MKRVITGEWDGQPISRPMTTAEELAVEITINDKEREMKKLRVANIQSWDYCPTCAETPRVLWQEEGESGDLSGAWIDCTRCEGTGMVDPQVEVTRL